MRRMMFVMVLGVSLGLFSQVNPDTLPEKYVKKVIIEAKWGDGPGEFGMSPYPESDPPVGPPNFYVHNDKIYVLDYLNRRVQVFDSRGGFLKEIRYNKKEISDSLASFVDIAVDNEEWVYLLGTLVYPARDGIIAVFDNSGRYVGKIKLPIELFADELLDGVKEGYFGQIVGGVDEFRVKDGALVLRYENKVYPLAHTNLLKGKGIGFSLTSPIRPPLKFYTHKEETIFKKIKKKSWAQFRGRDKMGEFFINRSIGIGENRTDEVLKYDHSGKLLARIVIPFSPGKFDIVRDLFVSDNGDVYYWTNDKDGLKIIKYSKEVKNEN